MCPVRFSSGHICHNCTSLFIFFWIVFNFIFLLDFLFVLPYYYYFQYYYLLWFLIGCNMCLSYQFHFFMTIKTMNLDWITSGTWTRNMYTTNYKTKDGKREDKEEHKWKKVDSKYTIHNTQTHYIHKQNCANEEICATGRCVIISQCSCQILEGERWGRGCVCGVRLWPWWTAVPQRFYVLGVEDWPQSILLVLILFCLQDSFLLLHRT